MRRYDLETGTLAMIADFGRCCTALAVILAAVFQLSMALAADPAFDAYLLGAGDRLRIVVAGHPRDSGEFDVDGLGKMDYPPLGRIRAQGRTIAEMRTVIRAGLDKAFDLNPEITIEVLNFRPFYIYGEVKRAGRYPYVAGLTVGRAVKIAGGFTGRARQSPIDLVREGRKGIVKLSGGLDRPVLPGDIIEISRQLK